jgi:hypothetical protein
MKTVIFNPGVVGPTVDQNVQTTIDKFNYNV